MTSEGGVEQLSAPNTSTSVCTSTTQHLSHLTQLPPAAAITAGGRKSIGLEDVNMSWVECLWKSKWGISVYTNVLWLVL